MTGKVEKEACQHFRRRKRGRRKARQNAYRPEKLASDRGADFVPIGWAVRLASVHSLAQAFRIRPDTACHFLTRIRVPLIQIDQTAYFNVPTLEARLYYLLRPGQQDLVQRRTQATGLAGILASSRFRDEWQAVARLYYDLSKKQTANRLSEIAGLLHRGLKNLRFTH